LINVLGAWIFIVSGTERLAVGELVSQVYEQVCCRGAPIVFWAGLSIALGLGLPKYLPRLVRLANG